MDRALSLTTLVVLAALLCIQSPVHSVQLGLISAEYNVTSHPTVNMDGRFAAFAASVSAEGESTVSAVVLTLISRSESSIISLDNAGQVLSGSPVPGGISGDGLHVLFSSDAGLLGCASGITCGYLRERNLGRTSLVTKSSEGAPPNSNSLPLGMSSDSRYVIFTSNSSTIVENDLNGGSDVFLADRQRRTVLRIGEALENSPDFDCPTSYASQAAMNAYGSLVAVALFCDGADVDIGGKAMVFLYNVSSASLLLVSKTASDSVPDADCTNPFISHTGTTVGFQSEATDIVAGADDGTLQVYIMKWSSGTVSLASISESGDPGNAASVDGAMSHDGCMVSFTSTATNLNSALSTGDNVFLFNCTDGCATPISLSSEDALGTSPSKRSSMSALGNVVAFETSAANLVNVSAAGNSPWIVSVSLRTSDTEYSAEDSGIVYPFNQTSCSRPNLQPIGSYMLLLCVGRPLELLEWVSQNQSFINVSDIGSNVWTFRVYGQLLAVIEDQDGLVLYNISNFPQVSYVSNLPHRNQIGRFTDLHWWSASYLIVSTEQAHLVWIDVSQLRHPWISGKTMFSAIDRIDALYVRTDGAMYGRDGTARTVSYIGSAYDLFSQRESQAVFLSELYLDQSVLVDNRIWFPNRYNISVPNLENSQVAMPEYTDFFFRTLAAAPPLLVTIGDVVGASSSTLYVSDVPATADSLLLDVDVTLSSYSTSEMTVCGSVVYFVGSTIPYRKENVHSALVHSPLLPEYSTDCSHVEGTVDLSSLDGEAEYMIEQTKLHFQFNESLLAQTIGLMAVGSDLFMLLDTYNGGAVEHYTIEPSGSLSFVGTVDLLAVVKRIRAFYPYVFFIPVQGYGIECFKLQSTGVLEKWFSITEGCAVDIWLRNEYAYVLLCAGNVAVYNVSDSTSPQMIALYPLQHPTISWDDVDLIYKWEFSASGSFAIFLRESGESKVVVSTEDMDPLLPPAPLASTTLGACTYGLSIVDGLLLCVQNYVKYSRGNWSTISSQASAPAGSAYSTARVSDNTILVGGNQHFGLYLVSSDSQYVDDTYVSERISPTYNYMREFAQYSNRVYAVLERRDGVGDLVEFTVSGASMEQSSLYHGNGSMAPPEIGASDDDPYSIKLVQNTVDTPVEMRTCSRQWAVFVMTETALYATCNRKTPGPLMIFSRSPGDGWTHVRNITDCGTVGDIDVEGALLVTACQGDGVYYYNISTPLNPLYMGNTNPPGFIESVSFAGGLLVASSPQDVIFLFRLSPSSSLELISSVERCCGYNIDGVHMISGEAGVHYLNGDMVLFQINDTLHMDTVEVFSDSVSAQSFTVFDGDVILHSFGLGIRFRSVNGSFDETVGITSIAYAFPMGEMAAVARTHAGDLAISLIRKSEVTQSYVAVASTVIGDSDGYTQLFGCGTDLYYLHEDEDGDAIFRHLQVETSRSIDVGTCSDPSDGTDVYESDYSEGLSVYVDSTVQYLPCEPLIMRFVDDRLYLVCPGARNVTICAFDPQESKWVPESYVDVSRVDRMKVYGAPLNLLVCLTDIFGILMFDVSSPNAPVRWNDTLVSTGDLSGTDFQIRNSILFVSHDSRKLTIYQLNEPSSTVTSLISETNVSPTDPLYAIALQENDRCVLCGTNRVLVYDVSDLGNPTRVVIHNAGCSASLVEIDGMVYRQNSDTQQIVASRLDSISSPSTEVAYADADTDLIRFGANYAAFYYPPSVTFYVLGNSSWGHGPNTRMAHRDIRVSEVFSYFGCGPRLFYAGTEASTGKVALFNLQVDGGLVEDWGCSDDVTGIDTVFTPSTTPTPSRSPSISSTPSSTISSTSTIPPSPTTTATASVSSSPSPSDSPTGSRTSTATESPTATATNSRTPSQSSTSTGTRTSSKTVGASPSRTSSVSSTSSVSPSRTATMSSTPSVSPSHSGSGTSSASVSISLTNSISATQTSTPSRSVSLSSTSSPTRTASRSRSRTSTSTMTSTSSVSRTRSGTSTATSSGTPASTVAFIPSVSRIPSASRTPSITQSATPSKSSLANDDTQGVGSIIDSVPTAAMTLLLSGPVQLDPCVGATYNASVELKDFLAGASDEALVFDWDVSSNSSSVLVVATLRRLNNRILSLSPSNLTSISIHPEELIPGAAYTVRVRVSVAVSILFSRSAEMTVVKSQFPVHLELRSEAILTDALVSPLFPTELDVVIVSETILGCPDEIVALSDEYISGLSVVWMQQYGPTAIQLPRGGKTRTLKIASGELACSAGYGFAPVLWSATEALDTINVTLNTSPCGTGSDPFEPPGIGSEMELPMATFTSEIGQQFIVRLGALLKNPSMVSLDWAGKLTTATAQCIVQLPGESTFTQDCLDHVEILDQEAISLPPAVFAAESFVKVSLTVELATSAGSCDLCAVSVPILIEYVAPQSTPVVIDLLGPVARFQYVQEDFEVRLSTSVSGDVSCSLESTPLTVASTGDRMLHRAIVPNGTLSFGENHMISCEMVPSNNAPSVLRRATAFIHMWAPKTPQIISDDSPLNLGLEMDVNPTTGVVAETVFDMYCEFNITSVGSVIAPRYSFYFVGEDGELQPIKKWSLSPAWSTVLPVAGNVPIVCEATLGNGDTIRKELTVSTVASAASSLSSDGSLWSQRFMTTSNDTIDTAESVVAYFSSQIRSALFAAKREGFDEMAKLLISNMRRVLSRIPPTISENCKQARENGTEIALCLELEEVVSVLENALMDIALTASNEIALYIAEYFQIVLQNICGLHEHVYVVGLKIQELFHIHMNEQQRLDSKGAAQLHFMVSITQNVFVCKANKTVHALTRDILEEIRAYATVLSECDHNAIPSVIGNDNFFTLRVDHVSVRTYGSPTPEENLEIGLNAGSERLDSISIPAEALRKHATPATRCVRVVATKSALLLASDELTEDLTVAAEGFSGSLRLVSSIAQVDVAADQAFGTATVGGGDGAAVKFSISPEYYEYFRLDNAFICTRRKSDKSWSVQDCFDPDVDTLLGTVQCSCNQSSSIAVGLSSAVYVSDSAETAMELAQAIKRTASLCSRYPLACVGIAVASVFLGAIVAIMLSIASPFEDAEGRIVVYKTHKEEETPSQSSIEPAQHANERETVDANGNGRPVQERRASMIADVVRTEDVVLKSAAPAGEDASPQMKRGAANRGSTVAGGKNSPLWRRSGEYSADTGFNLRRTPNQPPQKGRKWGPPSPPNSSTSDYSVAPSDVSAAIPSHYSRRVPISRASTLQKKWSASALAQSYYSKRSRNVDNNPSEQRNAGSSPRESGHASTPLSARRALNSTISLSSVQTSPPNRKAPKTPASSAARWSHSPSRQNLSPSRSNVGSQSSEGSPSVHSGRAQCGSDASQVSPNGQTRRFICNEIITLERSRDES